MFTLSAEEKTTIANHLRQDQLEEAISIISAKAPAMGHEANTLLLLHSRVANLTASKGEFDEGFFVQESNRLKETICQIADIPFSSIPPDTPFSEPKEISGLTDRIDLLLRKLSLLNEYASAPEPQFIANRISRLEEERRRGEVAEAEYQLQLRRIEASVNYLSEQLQVAFPASATLEDLPHAAAIAGRSLADQKLRSEKLAQKHPDKVARFLPITAAISALIRARKLGLVSLDGYLTKGARIDQELSQVVTGKK